MSSLIEAVPVEWVHNVVNEDDSRGDERSGDYPDGDFLNDAHVTSPLGFS